VTQHKQMIEEAKRLLNSKRENVPSLSWNIGDDFFLEKHPSGKIIQKFDDKRKRDVIIQESYSGGES